MQAGLGALARAAGSSAIAKIHDFYELGKTNVYGGVWVF